MYRWYTVYPPGVSGFYPEEWSPICEFLRDECTGLRLSDLITTLMIRGGAYLLCQVFLSLNWFRWSWLEGFWGVEPLDRKSCNGVTPKFETV